MNYVDIVKAFEHKNIFVIGDIILDEFIFGEVNRINPEAPVPILNVKKKEFQLGGAANVAKNIVSLGGKCLLLGITGDDDSSKILTELFKEKRINYLLFKDKTVPTSRKTRALAQNQHLLRLDFEETYKVNESFLNSLKKLFDEENFDAIIVSDYGKGTITEQVISILKSYNAPIFVDPKIKNKNLYSDVFVITPNLKEAKELNEGEDNLGESLVEKYNSNILITKGELGMTLYEKHKESHNIPTVAKEVYDVVGAGDVVISTLALAYSSCFDLQKASVISNVAAGIAVGKIGTSPVFQNELLSELSEESSKIKSWDELRNIVKELKFQGKKVVFTNGCFDILHTGHTRLLQFAKKQGDVLILGLNTDESITKLKGPTRPVNSQDKRAEVLANLDSVDYITLFGENTPLELLETIRPQIIIKGGDWKVENVVGNHIAEVRIFPTIEGESTTNTIEKIKGK